ncbi:MAG TPA: ATP-binding protein [Candidatus Polarisedimenticolia bacterium]|nr:ATP-binding protein [Candidatus Polarisedimenticolia bacterium]
MQPTEMRTAVSGFLSRHTLWVGFAAMLLPLLILLGLQLVWQRRLQETSAIAQRATLNGALDAVGSEIQYFYRSAAERLLNVPAEVFEEGKIDVLAQKWSGKLDPGMARLFVVDFTRASYGEYRQLDPESQRMIAFPASDEAMALIAAVTPYQMASFRGTHLPNPTPTVDERSPDFRIVLNPITNAEGRVIAVAGMVLDPTFLRKTLLPEAIRKAVEGFFPLAREGDIDVMVKDAQGRLMYGTEDRADQAEVVTANLPFAFTDWMLVLHSHRSTPQRMARANFAINITLVAMLAAFLVGGIVMALRAADRAMRLSQMKSDFVSNVSHELRTPVASIRVFAELLRLGRVPTPEKMREYGEYIERESRRLSRLIDNILDFSRIESGRKTYSFAPADPRAIVEATLQSFGPHLRHHGFTATLIATDGRLGEILADADALAQAVHNLLDNAVKYSGSSKAIEVRLAREWDDVVIAVRDFGIGIPREEQAKIFERFHRVGTVLRHEVKGSGLGLALVQHIVTVHGGRIAVESEPGKGSIFTIHLPVRQQPVEEPAPATGAPRDATT